MLSFRNLKFGWLIPCLLLCAPVGRTQDTKAEAQQPQQPLSATGVTDSSNANAVVPYSNEEPAVSPDTRPLSGFQQLSLGTSNTNRSFLLPSFTAVGQVQSNPYTSGQFSGTNVTGTGTLMARLALNRITPLTALTLDYLAGATFSSGLGQGTSGIQSLDVSDTFQRGRWGLLVGDQLSYLSQSPFGFGGLGGLSGYGVPLGNGGVGSSSGLGSGTSPDQTILTGSAARVSNGVIGQITYSIDHRSSMTFGADYGVLKYLDDGFANNSNIVVRAGYNHALTRHDTVSVSYFFNRFMFGNTTPPIEAHGILLGYAKRLTNRLSLQVSAGPEIEMFTAAQKGPSNLVSWSVLSGLNYSRGALTAGVSYSHGLNGGSGILTGAESDTVTGTMGRSFNRDWNGSTSLGYSKNRTLEQTTGNNNFSTHGWYFEARMNRRFFAHGSLFVAYSLSKSTGVANVCNLPACQLGELTHAGSVGYTWGLRQIVLE